MKKIFTFFAFITILLSHIGCSTSEKVDPINIPNPSNNSEYPKIDLTSIKSNIVYDNYTYPIKIYLPRSYESNKNLPIIYALDGKYGFDNILNSLGSESEVIVVGFGDFAFKQQWQRRWEDLIPEDANCHGIEGKHLDFYNFITEELIPFIDENYENDKDTRILVGHSSAGLFTFVTMFMEDQENPIFRNFVASDPELECDQGYFIDLINENNFSNNDIKFKLFLSVSGDGDGKAMSEIATMIQSKEYPWLTFKYQGFFSEGHISSIVPSISSGLKFIFEN